MPKKLNTIVEPNDISDSQTVDAKSAILGVPSIKDNTIVGRIIYLEELISQYPRKYEMVRLTLANLLVIILAFRILNNAQKS